METRIEVLEVPTDLYGLPIAGHLFPNTFFDFRRFAGLKDLGFPQRALRMEWMNDAGKSPQDVFAPTLEVLRVSEAEIDIESLLRGACSAKNSKKLPALR